MATAATLTFHTLVFHITCCGSNTTTHFSYSACFRYALATATTLTFHTSLQRLFSICCGTDNSLFVHFEDPVHDGDVPALHLEHHDLPHTDGLLPVVGQKQQVPPVEGWLHATTATNLAKFTERSQVQIPAGMAGEFYSPGSTFCADSYLGISVPLPCYCSST